MSLFVDIDTNPQALRYVAEQIMQYSRNQQDIIEEYYYKMLSLQDDIDTEGYKDILEEIRRNKCKVEDIHRLCVLAFAAFLIQKAELLESKQSGSYTPSINASHSVGHTFSGPSYSTSYESSGSSYHANHKYPNVSSYSTRGSNSYSYDYEPSTNYKSCLSQPIMNYTGHLDFDRTTFKNGEYKTYVVEKPFGAYRYFGSYDSPGKDRMESGDYSIKPSALGDINPIDWGADAVGRWCSPVRSNDSEYVKNNLATMQKWGNDAQYVAEICVPKGTVISIGIAGEQGNLEGGGVQIFIHGKREDVLNHPEGIGQAKSAEREANDKKLFEEMLKDRWVKRCGPLDSFEFDQYAHKDNKNKEFNEGEKE